MDSCNSEIISGEVSKNENESVSESVSISEKQMNKYNEWKSNSPLLYDILVSFNLNNIPLSVQIGEIIDNNECFTTNELYIGMTDDKSEDSGILVKNVSYPNLNFLKEEDSEEKDKRYYSTLLKDFKLKCKDNKNKIVKKIPHKGDVNRMKFNPNNRNILATKSSDSNIYLIDTKLSKTVLTLEGHSEEGYGIAWSKENKLISGSYDKKVIMYQLSDFKDQKVLFDSSEHKDVVEDVGFNKFNENIFASVGDDKRLIM